MNSMLLYVRNLLGWTTTSDENNHRLKRERVNNEFSVEDELPYSKKFRPESQYSRHKVMASDDLLNGHHSDDNDSTDEVEFVHEIKPRNVRYIPIQIEGRKPVTSTPNECTVRTVPLRVVNENGDDNHTHTPSRKAGHSTHSSVISQYKNRPKIILQIDDDSDEDGNYEDDDDVIYVRKIIQKPQKYRLITKREGNSQKQLDKSSSSPYKLETNLHNRTQPDITSRSNCSKLISGGGVTKVYRKTTTAKRVRQLQQSSLKNKFTNMTCNSDSILSKLYDIEQKDKYRHLINNYFQTELNTSTKTFQNPLYKWKNGSKEVKLQDSKIFYKDTLVNGNETSLPSRSHLNSSQLSEKGPPPDHSNNSSLGKVNTLEDSFKTHAWYNCNFVDETKSKYTERNNKMKEKLTEVTLESDTMSKVNKQTKVALLEKKFKSMAVTIEGVVEEDSTVPFPDLTPEQEKRLKRVWGPGPSGEVIVEKFNLRITRKDLQTLSNLNWLNDEVINFYMNLLMQRSQDRPDLPKVYATNTFFYPKLMQSGQAGLKRWTRKVDIFAHDLMAVPVHLGVHWCMSLVDFRARRISYLDSMGGRNPRALAALLQYLRDEHLDKKNIPFDDSGWVTESLTDIPQQMNGSDCGMFSCTFAEFSARNAPYKFTQAHMPYLRRKAAVEIMEGRLLL